jgi:hypothetical protein
VRSPYGGTLRIWRAVFPDIAERGHAQVDIGILGMGSGTPGPDLKDHCGRLAAILQVVAVRFTGFEAGAIAGVEHGFAELRIGRTRFEFSVLDQGGRRALKRNPAKIGSDSN